MENRKIHWENVYQNKNPEEVSWTQKTPKTSLEFISGFNLSKTANIIDVGGGDGNLVDFLLKEGYENISVLDISETALNKAKARLGKHAEKITWIVSDITDFNPKTKYDLWHDRATFHFLTQENQIKVYLNLLKSAAKGYLVAGTFSESGPSRCSGLDVKQYDEENLVDVLSDEFEKIRCIKEDHRTPFDTLQSFLYCSFKKLG